MIRKKTPEPTPDPKYPGIAEATDGTGAVVHSETLASEAAGAYPITPASQMGEGWAEAVAAGKTNAQGRRLLFFEPEGEHAAAGVTAGMAMMGLRSANFSASQGIAYMHESLYAAVGKRLTYVLNMACRAMTKHALNIHAGHDDYHAVDDTGFFQLFAKNAQEAADLNLIAHRIAELSLNPGILAQDGFLTSHVIESVLLPEPELIREYLGDPSDVIESPTPAQELVFGETRRRIPEMFDLDFPTMLGSVQNQDSYAQGVAAQRPFYFDHVRALTERAMEEYAALTGRRYARAAGYRLDDADYVLVGQGTVVGNAEAVADHLRESRGLRVGVLNLTMFRPFPSDLVASLLGGKKGVTVLERVDQPLAVDPPLLREIRSAMGKAVENGRARKGRKGDGRAPHDGVPALDPDDVPDFYSAGFGFGSRDIQAGDLIAAVDNMTDDDRQRRQFYLGIDFIREGTRLPKLQIWQESILDGYPHLKDLALEPAGDIDLLPEGTIALRIHSVGGWGAVTTGKNLAITSHEVAGLHIKANPKYGSEKKGQPTTFYATLAKEPVRLNAELRHVDVVLSPDPNVFRHSNPLAGLREGGVFVIQSDESPEELWELFPAWARREMVEKGIRLYGLDGFSIAAEEASVPELRYRMQGAAFMGAFFAVSPMMETEALSRDEVFEAIGAQLQRKFGSKGQSVVDANVEVIRRGFDEVFEVPKGEAAGDAEAEAAVPPIPSVMDQPSAHGGIGNPGRFYEQVCATCALGQDIIADPFTAISGMPMASAAVRDMTDIRFEVPDFVASKCTGCSQCWVQCPDSAIPGLVTPVDDLIDRAISYAGNGRSLDRMRQVSRHLVKECRKVLDSTEFEDFGKTLKTAYGNLVPKLGWDAERRSELDDEFAAVFSVLSDFPLAKTTPFYDVPEGKEKGTGGLLSVTVSPEACKGCNICVEVCPEDALVTVKQDEEIVEELRENWKFWEHLPDTPDEYIAIRDLDEGIGVLSSLLLKKRNYQSMVGGDGACMGCGEKTTVHLVTSAIEAFMQDKVKDFVAKLDDLIEELDAKARDLLTADADVEDVASLAGDGRVDLELDDEKSEALARYADSIRALKDLRWRYVEGPSGRGRAALGITNSTGCSSVWGSTFPYNPYPFPWANHLFQDAPSLAIGVFEGHMRKMADNFADVRKAELLVDDAYDPEEFRAFREAFDWREFTDEEFELCPPILSIGGDGAMLDIGFQNLSRLMASGKPIRVMVLDTQVYSNTGGQACTSGFTGQIADMSAYGSAQHGKEETRKELSLIAMAHRGTYVLQSSQALPAHLISGVLKGLQSRRPAIFNVYTPCPVEHGLPDEWAPHAAKLALESRAFPLMTYDPDAGETWAECLTLEGNPALDESWPTYELEYVDDDGEERTMELPLTTADWAVTEGRFKKHFRSIADDEWSDDQVLFHEFVEMDDEERVGKTPFIWSAGDDGGLRRTACSLEMVELADDRLLLWSQIRQLAGLEIDPWVRQRLTSELETEFEEKADELRAEYEEKLDELRSSYPALVARRLAEGLVRSGNGKRTVEELLETAESTPGLEPISLRDAAARVKEAGGGAPAPAGSAPGDGDAATATAGATAVATEAPPAEAPEEVEEEAEEAEEEGGLAMEPYIETARCTTCNDCTNLNPSMFKYDENKQAYIADPTAGPYSDLVKAAERCPAAIIHPGDPLDGQEPDRDLEKWIERAEPFN